MSLTSTPSRRSRIRSRRYASVGAGAIKAGTPSSNGWERLMTSHAGSTTSIQAAAARVFIAIEVSKRNWLRHQPGSALSQWFCDRVGSTKGRLRRIAVVALARKLLVALWRFVTTGLIPTGATMKPA